MGNGQSSRGTPVNTSLENCISPQGKNKYQTKQKQKDKMVEKHQTQSGGTTSEEGQQLVDSRKMDEIVDFSNRDENVGSRNIDEIAVSSKNYKFSGPSKNDQIAGPSKTDQKAASTSKEPKVESAKCATAASFCPKENPFPFENLVFEGGGNKGLAYVGCLKYLEEMNIMKQIRRVGGSSAGAITAALVALGYTAEEIEGFLSENVQDIFLDHSFGYLSLLPNLVRKFGWNPGKKIFKWFGDKIKQKSKTSNPDMTFLDLYKERKHMELCVVVTNINQMQTEYCHVKKTPDMPIRVALRMSMAIPGIFAARKYENHGQSDFYVDGGMLCNYPVHCFDGWYLSMTESDSFFEKLKSPFDMTEEKPFEPVHQETLGFLLFEDTEKEVMRSTLEERKGALVPEKPKRETTLFKSKEATRKKVKEAEIDYKARREATKVLFTVLKEYNKSETDCIDKNELKEALNDTNLSEHKALLFGSNETAETIFKTMDKNQDGKISFMEFRHLYEKRANSNTGGAHCYLRKDVKSFTDYLSAVQNTLLINLKLVHFKAGDAARTVGINTGHIGTSDYVLEDEDRAFIVERGVNATKAFFDEYQKIQRNAGGAIKHDKASRATS